MSLSLFKQILLICVLLCAPSVHGAEEIQPLTEDAFEFLTNLFNWFLEVFERTKACHHNKQFGVLTLGVLRKDELVPSVLTFTQNVTVESISPGFNYIATVPQPQVRQKKTRQDHTETQLIRALNYLKNYESLDLPDDVYLFTFNSPCPQCARALQNLAWDNNNTKFHIGYAITFSGTLNETKNYLKEQNIYLGQVGDVCPAVPNRPHDELKMKRSSTCTVISCKAAYRSDYRCGDSFLAPNGKIAECKPDGESPCCSEFHWCGNTADYCECDKCVDYRPNYRSDYRCGGSHLAPNGEVAKCNPDGESPCCSEYEWCGNTADYCECDKCVDYRFPYCDSWGSWGRCSKTCGGGMQFRFRKCVGGSDCCDSTSDEKPCNTQSCPYCGSWGSWSGCSQSCDGGWQYRFRSCVGGSNCCGSTSETRQCNTQSCPSCFASDSMVRVKQQTNNDTQIQHKRIDELKVGDYVESYDRETNSVAFSEVYFISHDGDTGNSFRLLKLIVGSEHNKELPLRMHPKHLVYSCKTRTPDDESTTSYKEEPCRHPPENPVTAESVKVGDTLWVRNSIGEFVPRPVIGIGETRNGIRHPMTLNHCIVVDNVLASVHMYDEGLYRQITAPIRFAYSISPSITDSALVKNLVQMWDSVEDRYF